jgi:hypothetical protein
MGIPARFLSRVMGLTRLLGVSAVTMVDEAGNYCRVPAADRATSYSTFSIRVLIAPGRASDVHLLDHPLHRLADILSEDLLQLCHQRCPFLQLRRVVRSPLPVTTQNATIFKAQESETSSVYQIDDFALLFFYLVSGELLRGPILPANRAAKGRCLSLFERTW